MAGEEPLSEELGRAGEMEEIGEAVLSELARQDRLREEALRLSRSIIRAVARSIRSLHRREFARSRSLLDEAGQSILRLEQIVRECPLFYAVGYVADAQKEYAEGRLVHALVRGEEVPSPQALGVPVAPYLNALGEAAGELRRSILDALRRDEVVFCETWLEAMQQIYDLLTTVDYPDALTGGLRRTTDMVRRVLENTRADLTSALRQRRLQKAMEQLEKRL